MKKLLLSVLAIVTAVSTTGCVDLEGNLSDIEQVVEYLNASTANYNIKTISSGCCQYEGSVDGSIVRREKTHYNYDSNGDVSNTEFTVYYYDVTASDAYTIYTSNTTYSADEDYKNPSSWTSAEKISVTAPYLLTFDLCACCSDETSSNFYVFDLEAENDETYATVSVDLTNGLSDVVVTVITTGGTTYQITGFNTVVLELPCTVNC